MHIIIIQSKLRPSDSHSLTVRSPSMRHFPHPSFRGVSDSPDRMIRQSLAPKDQMTPLVNLLWS